MNYPLVKISYKSTLVDIKGFTDVRKGPEALFPLTFNNICESADVLPVFPLNFSNAYRVIQQR